MWSGGVVRKCGKLTHSHVHLQLQASHVEGEGLKCEVASLTSQLAEARGKQEALAQALATARQAMEIYQETAQRDVRESAGITAI